MRLKLIAPALALLAATAAAPALAEGDVEQGRLLGYTCLGCHGIAGYRNAYPSYRVPKLGGQKAAYLEAALIAYREGTRPHPTMQAQGSTLSDTDIDDLVAWIASQGTAQDDIDAGTPGLPAAAQACLACHGTAGQDISPAPPVLSGQERSYLEHALRQYRDEARGANLMNSFAAGLSDRDIRQLARFYSEQEGLETLAEGE